MVMFGLLMLLVFVMIRFRIQNNALKKIRKQMAELENRLRQLEPAQPATMPARVIEPIPAPPIRASKAIPVGNKAPAAAQATPAAVLTVTSAGKTTSGFDEWIAALFKLLFGGNLFMKLGALILFVGLGFFIRYLTTIYHFPMELRLAAVAIGGLGLLLAGWRVRCQQREASLILQGTGIGVVYMTLFASAKFFSLISPFLALSFMVSMVVLAVIMAVLQDASLLALMALAGGFLAPVLVSTHSGSHVVLFVFYAFLNLGILVINRFKPWRYLNLLGFIFTFAIGTLWGYQSYHAYQFSSTEPFLIIFFLIYFFGQLFLVMRDKTWKTSPVVDSTILYGLPLLAFSLQSYLTQRFEYGVAFSALGFGIFYIAMAFWLWKTQKLSMQYWVIRYLLIGSAFATLAIPVAFENQVGGIIWSLEGAALLALGVQEKNPVSRWIGMGLQLASAILILPLLNFSSHSVFPILNANCLLGAILSISLLYSAYRLEQARMAISSLERFIFLPLLFLGGLLFWYGVGFAEIFRLCQDNARQIQSMVVFAGVSALLQAGIAKRWQAIGLRYAVLLLPILMLVLYLPERTALFENVGFDLWRLLAWVSGIGLQLGVIRLLETEWRTAIAKFQHLLGFWLVLMVMSGELSGGVDWLTRGQGDWALIMTGILPGIVIWLGLRQRWFEKVWPAKKHPELYAAWGLVPVACYLWGWVLVTCFILPRPWPVHYFPILNSLEIVQLFSIWFFFVWLWDTRKLTNPVLAYLPKRLGWYAFSVAAVLLVTTMIGRSLHAFGKIPYTLANLYASLVFQTLVSIIWTLVAIGIILVAAQRKHRESWFGGAGLLALVVIKLFVVDLSASETMTRVVSFVAVGLLMLLIGYLSPLPPIQKRSEIQ